MVPPGTAAPPRPGKKAPAQKKETALHFAVHGKEDMVGVMVADVNAGQECTGWNMDTDETIKMKANHDIPLGHKIALLDIPQGNTVIKYGVGIGKATSAIKKGDWVHTHNLKTARW
jgi:(2R)-sulfolactate sulfo-lyase subunit alpha